MFKMGDRVRVKNMGKVGVVVEVLGSVSHVRMLNGNLTVVPTAWLEVAV